MATQTLDGLDLAMGGPHRSSSVITRSARCRGAESTPHPSACDSARRSARLRCARRRPWNGSLVPRIWFVITSEPENMRLTCRYVEPPIGIEPMTYALREGLEPSMAV